MSGFGPVAVRVAAFAEAWEMSWDALGPSGAVWYAPRMAEVGFFELSWEAALLSAWPFRAGEAGSLPAAVALEARVAGVTLGRFGATARRAPRSVGADGFLECCCLRSASSFFLFIISNIFLVEGGRRSCHMVRRYEFQR